MGRSGHGESEFARLAEAYIQVARKVHKRGEGLLNYFLEMAEMELVEVLASDARKNASGVPGQGGKGSAAASSRST